MDRSRNFYMPYLCLLMPANADVVNDVNSMLNCREYVGHLLAINTVLCDMSIHTSVWVGQINYNASFITVRFSSRHNRAYVTPGGEGR